MASLRAVGLNLYVKVLQLVNIEVLRCLPQYYIYDCRIPDIQTPRERMVQVVRWYMSAFHASRNADIAKKPYNPILGETFRCYWNVPGYPKSEVCIYNFGPIIANIDKSVNIILFLIKLFPFGPVTGPRSSVLA